MNIIFLWILQIIIYSGTWRIPVYRLIISSIRVTSFWLKIISRGIIFCNLLTWYLRLLDLCWLICSRLYISFLEIIAVAWTYFWFIFVYYIWGWSSDLSWGLGFIGRSWDLFLNFVCWGVALVRHTVCALPCDSGTVFTVVRWIESIWHSLIAYFFNSIFKIKFEFFY